MSCQLHKKNYVTKIQFKKWLHTALTKILQSCDDYVDITQPSTALWKQQFLITLLSCLFISYVAAALFMDFSMVKLLLQCTLFLVRSSSFDVVTKHFIGYSSGQSHFSEINAKLAEENEFVTHFVQKCLETHENEQTVVLNESSEALRNRSDFGTSLP